MLFRRCAVLLFSFVLTSLLYSQVAEAPAAARLTFKAKVQVVLLDVVVSGQNHRPITGLHRDDFEIFENFKQQTIASFEEHRGAPPGTVAPRPSLPPHFYSNAPLVEPPGSVNVLLLDSLNTEFADQATVRLEMINYLKTIRPGPYLAIFTLGARLRMVEGFTDDPKALLEALNHKHWGGTPETSPQLRTSSEDNLDQAILSRMSEGNGMNPGAPAGAIAALRDFLAEAQATQALTRMSSTLDALQDLSRYLSGFRGRKNIIWFSGSFPEIEFPANSERARVDLDSSNGLSKQMKDTIDMLAGAQIAVYPISAQGLETQSFYEASNLSGRASGLQNPNIEGQNQALHNDNVNRYFNQKSADDIASNTGGEAFDNSNGLKDALAKVVEEGAYYYRLSYSPTDKKMMGRYRHIRVNINDGPHPTASNIAYRRGYYEENEKQQKAAEPELPTDYLRPLMNRGLPDATEIVYNLRLLRSGTQVASGATPVGDNKNLHGPVTRISADFVIPLDNLDFELTPDGVRHGNLELSLVAYDHAGRPLNWVVRSIRTSLKSELYSSVQKTGVQFHQELDVPNADHLYLRSGIYDLESSRAGTLELPLSEVTAEHLAAESQMSPVETSATSGATVSSASRPTPAPSGSPLSPKKSDADIALASGLTKVGGPPQPSALIREAPSVPAAKEPEVSDIPAYCGSLTSSVEHPAALARVCEFVLSMEQRLPNVICDREMTRYWKEHAVKHSDIVTAHVSYRDGKEYYEDVRLDGQPVSSEASIFAAASMSGTWSVGEFATVLAGVFLPSSHPDFVFERQARIGSAKALSFRFHVDAQHNRSYFLFVGDKVWFPEYGGELWIDGNSFQLLRLKRETAYMHQYPIRQVKTSIDYDDVPLGDGSRLVLPVRSEVLTCAAAVDGHRNDCSRNIVKFTNWHKFGATTTIVMTPGN